MSQETSKLAQCVGASNPPKAMADILDQAAGRNQDDLIGKRPLPKKPEPPRSIPEIDYAMYINIMRATS